MPLVSTFHAAKLSAELKEKKKNNNSVPPIRICIHICLEHILFNMNNVFVLEYISNIRSVTLPLQVAGVYCI